MPLFYSLSSPFLAIQHPCSVHPKENTPKINSKENKTTAKTHLALLSFQNLFFVLVALGATVCHIVYPFVQSALPTYFNFVVCCWSGSRPLPLAYHYHGTLSKTPLGYPAITCCGTTLLHTIKICQSY